MFKGQIISLDLTLAVLVFILILAISVNYWETTISNIDSSQERSDVSRKALEVSDLMVKSVGIPDNWENNTANLKVIGIVNESQVIDKKKFDAFLNLSNQTIVNDLGIQGYAVYIQFKNNSKQVTASIGWPVNNTARNVATVERNVVYEGMPGYIVVTVWIG